MAFALTVTASRREAVTTILSASGEASPNEELAPGPICEGEAGRRRHRDEPRPPTPPEPGGGPDMNKETPVDALDADL
jgi:hypothetical protein